MIDLSVMCLHKYHHSRTSRSFVFASMVMITSIDCSFPQAFLRLTLSMSFQCNDYWGWMDKICVTMLCNGHLDRTARISCWLGLDTLVHVNFYVKYVWAVLCNETPCILGAQLCVLPKRTCQWKCWMESLISKAETEKDGLKDWFWGAIIIVT
jgi:hypothetical protein